MVQPRRQTLTCSRVCARDRFWSSGKASCRSGSDSTGPVAQRRQEPKPALPFGLGRIRGKCDSNAGVRINQRFRKKETTRFATQSANAEINQRLPGNIAPAIDPGSCHDSAHRGRFAAKRGEIYRRPQTGVKSARRNRCMRQNAVLLRIGNGSRITPQAPRA